MENASKALIIAGAILLSIILISLGIMVVNNARSTVKDADISDTEKQAFNSKFSSYLGNAITSNQLNALLSAVQSSNISENKSGKGRYVGVDVTGYADGSASSAKKTYGNTATEGTYAAITSIPTYSSAYTYKAVGAYSDKTGLLWKITVTTNNK